MTISRLGSIVTLLCASLAGRAAAQQPTVVPLTAAADTARPGERPNGALLHPGSFVYRLSSRRDTLFIPLGVRTVVVSEATVAGTPAWLIAESRTGTVVETSDSLYLARADLAPERWVAAIGRTQLAASFARDSMFAALQTYQGRSSFSAAVPPGTLLSGGMVDRVVELLPLQAGYRTETSLLLVDMGGPRAVPATVSVEREDPVALSDRTVDCWVVLLQAGATVERLWVTKESPQVVKTEQATGAGLLSALLEPAPPVPTVIAAGAPATPVAAPVAELPLPAGILYPPRCPPPCRTP
jgi:hypothetical protein